MQIAGSNARVLVLLKLSCLISFIEIQLQLGLGSSLYKALILFSF